VVVCLERGANGFHIGPADATATPAAVRWMSVGNYWEYVALVVVLWCSALLSSSSVSVTALR